MQEQTKRSAHRAERRKAFLEAGFEMYSAKSIESVRLEEISAATGHGIATLYRHFGNKANFLVEISAWKWGEFFRENRKRRPSENFEGATAADMFAFCLESFLELYRGQRALLRFNQLFNVYLRSGEDVTPETVALYRGLMQPLTEFFHEMYERGKRDGTLRTEIPEEEMLSATVHLMLAVVTRYAVGLVYQPADDFDAERELETQKRMLYREYTRL